MKERSNDIKPVFVMIRDYIVPIFDTICQETRKNYPDVLYRIDVSHTEYLKILVACSFFRPKVDNPRFDEDVVLMLQCTLENNGISCKSYITDGETSYITDGPSYLLRNDNSIDNHNVCQWLKKTREFFLAHSSFVLNQLLRLRNEFRGPISQNKS